MIKLTKSIIDKLDKYSKERKLPVEMVIELAIEEYIDRSEQSKTKCEEIKTHLENIRWG